MTTHVIKQHSRRMSEVFDESKLRASIEAACLSVRLPEGVASDTAKQVTATVSTWLSKRPEVTSNDIRRVATAALTKVSPEASYLYQHHKHII